MANRTRLLALVAALSAANAAFRIGLAWGPPNVKPTVFLVIIGGVVAGPVPGFIIGWLSMTISDIATPLGAGYWTIETSALMAVVGLFSGFLWHRASNISRIRMAVGGYLLAVLFNIGTAIVDSVVYSYPLMASIMGLYVPFLSGGLSPYPFGLALELTTAILCGTIGPSLITQIRKVYH